MVQNQSSFIWAGVIFLFIFLSGYWLRKFGKPLNGLVLTIHKFFGLGMGVFLILTIYRTNQVASLFTKEIIATTVTVFLFFIMVATGGLLSTNKQISTKFLRLHQLIPFLTVISTGLTLYFLLSR